MTNHEMGMNKRTAGIRMQIAILLAGMMFLPVALRAQTLATMDGDKVTAEEFRAMYRHTYQNLPQYKSDAEKFLERLVDFKVKRLEAHALGIDSEKPIQDEIRAYRNDLAISYLVEKKLVDQGIQRYYTLRKEEMLLWHIFFRFSKRDDGTVDTTEAYAHGMELLPKIRNSALPFDSLVMLYSEDDARDRTRGRLGWWIAGSGYPEIDEAVFKMKAGDISNHLVRSPFGFHIFYVEKRRPALTRVRGSHILYRLDLNNPLDTAAAYARLSLVLDTLKKGLATFEDLARRNSMDPVSGADGGDLGWMDRGTLEDNFEHALFDLKPGETSGIVRSKFGMHIIRKSANDERPSLEIQTPALKQIYMRERYAKDYQQYVQSLLVKHEYKPQANIKKLLLSRLKKGTTTSTPDWWKALKQKDLNAYLYYVDGKSYTIGEAVERIKTDPQLQMRRFTSSGLDSVIALLAQRNAMVEESATLEKEYPEFAKLMKEYSDGVYVTAVETREVYDKVTVTDEELHSYWLAHKSEFRYPNRVQFSEIMTYGEQFMQGVIDSLKAGHSFDELQAKLSRRTGVNSKRGEWGLVPVNLNELSTVAWDQKEGDISGMIKTQRGVSIVRTNKKDPAHEKTFEEAKQEALAKLKEGKLEKAKMEWIQHLRAKYHVEIDAAQINSVLVQ